MVCRLMLVISLLAWSNLFSAQVFAGRDDHRLDIYWIDVEGGAATLAVTPTGESVLIDTGNPGFRDPNRIVQLATNVAGLRQIDHLIITHYHVDHYGGAEPLSKLIPVKNVYDNGIFDGMPDNPGKAYFEFECEKRVVIHPGDQLPLRQDETSGAAPVSFRCLAARKLFAEPTGKEPANHLICADARTKDRDGSDNANSIVMILEFGPFRFFDGGDLTWNQETRLVCPVNLIGEVDVYQVTHHGLDMSNNPLVIRSVKPSVAIMNNGERKGCMPEVFANLAATPSIQAVYQMHKNLRDDGATNNVPDEYVANLESAERCAGNYIKLSVAPDGMQYTVSIPANGHQRTFATQIR